jgi:hypothetical protein
MFSPLEKSLSTSAYASVDNDFLGVKIFNITLNYMNHLFYYTEGHFSYIHVYIWKLDVESINERDAVNCDVRIV